MERLSQYFKIRKEGDLFFVYYQGNRGQRSLGCALTKDLAESMVFEALREARAKGFIH